MAQVKHEQRDSVLATISLHIATSRFGNQPYYANQTSTARGADQRQLRLHQLQSAHS